MQITLKGNAKSTQQIYKYRLMGTFISGYMSKEGKDTKEAYTWEMRAQYKGKPTASDIELTIALYFGDKRVRDIDNFNKLILDAGTGILWVDDSQIQKLTITKHYDKENPRVELFF